MDPVAAPPPPPPPQPTPTWNGSPQVVKPTQSRRKPILIFSLFLLIIGAVSAVVLVSKEQFIAPQAWNCAAYNFHVSQTGAVSVSNQSSRSEPVQKVAIHINNSPVSVLDVPALAAGQSADLGTVTVPNSGTFTWNAVGSKDCSDEGSYTAPTAVPPTPTPIPPSPTPTCDSIECPSGTPFPSPTVTATPTPTATPQPSPTDTPSPSSTPSPSPTPTSSPGTGGDNIVTPTATPTPQAPSPTPPPTSLPQSGASSSTWIVAAFGLITLTFGLFLL